MKYVLYLTCLLCFKPTFSQNHNSLKKYSYLVVAYKKGLDTVLGIGIGFFTKVDNGYYFITAKHVITGISPFTLKREHQPADILTVFFNDSSGNAVSYLDIPIGAVAKSMSAKRYYEEPDIVILELTGLEKSQSFINCVYLNHQQQHAKIEGIVSWGYGLSNSDSLVKLKQIQVKDIKPMIYEGVLADVAHTDPSDHKKDSLNIRIQPETLRGMSGGPVFFNYKLTRNSKNVYELGGAIFSGNALYHSAFIVSYNTIVDKINDLRFPKYLFRY